MLISGKSTHLKDAIQIPFDCWNSNKSSRLSSCHAAGVATFYRSADEKDDVFLLKLRRTFYFVLSQLPWTLSANPEPFWS